MTSIIPEGEKELQFLSQLAKTTDRRQFLRWSGVTLAVVAVGCSSDTSVAPNATPTAGAAAGAAGAAAAEPVNLGTGDVLVLNFALALEQLEAAFYTKVESAFYAGATAAEMAILRDIAKHERVHRDFLFAALGAAAIPPLEVTFASVDFTSRTSVLTTARIFEDLGVSAYNGAGKYLMNPDFLVTAGKIVSVEARHAAVIRDLLQPKTAYFAGDDVVDPNGLDVVRTPAAVAALAAPFIVTPIDVSTLPSS
jgi:hypothetical protein